MKIYITVENIARLKKSFLNLKSHHIISIENILEELGYSYNAMDEYETYIINNKITELFNASVKSKKIKNIIYVNPYLSKEILDNIFDKVNNLHKDNTKVLLDDYNVPKLKEYYKDFDEILYFPLIKKVRLMDNFELK